MRRVRVVGVTSLNYVNVIQNYEKAKCYHVSGDWKTIFRAEVDINATKYIMNPMW